MPTVWRIRDKWKVMVYAGDHAPPHFHIFGPDCSIVIDIATLRVVRGEGPDAIVREACAWASDHGATLMAKWIELNEREDD